MLSESFEQPEAEYSSGMYLWFSSNYIYELLPDIRQVPYITKKKRKENINLSFQERLFVNMNAFSIGISQMLIIKPL